MTDPKQIRVIAAKNTAYAWKAIVTRNAGMSINQKRIGALIIALFLSVSPAFAQGTILPPPIFVGLDSSGNPLVSGKLCTYEAGTNTPATTYTTSALSIAHTNPVILDAAGRAIIFLRPGSSYKFVLYSAGSDQTCSTGTLQWSSDNISALPSSNVNLDVTGTAGESLAAGDLVYLSTSTSQWMKTDADNAASSTSALQIGMVPAAIASGDSGTIRLAGVVTVTGPLTPGGSYYASSTAGGLTATPPMNAIRVGQADSATSIILGFTKAPVSPRGPPCGRLTGTSATPVTTADVTAITTLYYALYGGCNQIDLFNGTNWTTYAIAELSIAVPATTATVYDVFAYDNSGVVALELTAWSSGTARATALVLQDGVLVKTGATTRRYLGTFRTSAVSGQTTDALISRLIWNYYHRVPRQLQKFVSTNSWTYSTSTWRQANADTANQAEFVIGVAEALLDVTFGAVVQNDTGGVYVGSAMGLDSTTTPPTQRTATVQIKAASEIVNNSGSYAAYPAIGYHFLAILERSQAVGVTTWWSNSNLAGFGEQTGFVGWIKG